MLAKAISDLAHKNPMAAAGGLLLKPSMGQLREEFDLIIVDAPPLAHYADAIALGRVADGVVLVIEAESTRRDSALAAVENLRSCDVRILGAVLNLAVVQRVVRALEPVIVKLDAQAAVKIANDEDGVPLVDTDMIGEHGNEGGSADGPECSRHPAGVP